MKQFPSIQKLDTAILYALELSSSISVLLLAFGLISSMANVLTKGSVLSESAFLQEVWAWTQCVAIDANVAGSIIRTYTYHQQDDKLKMWLYGLLSLVLLFTACIVSNIEAVKQTLNITLDSAYTHVFVPVELLIWIRSLAIVLIIVSHALRHVNTGEQTQQPATASNLNMQLSVQKQTVTIGAKGREDSCTRAESLTSSIVTEAKGSGKPTESNRVYA